MRVCSDLPPDFKEHWAKNFIFELSNFPHLIKRLYKDTNNNIQIYYYKFSFFGCTTEFNLIYNFTTKCYVINGKHFEMYKDALDYMWKLTNN